MHAPEKLVNGLLAKRCGTCFQFYPLDSFPRCHSRRHGRHSRCKACRKLQYYVKQEEYRQKSRDWHKRNPERSRLSSKASKLKQKFGLTLPALEEMVRVQKGCCYICKVPCKLSVDHNHATGRVRALLCCNCNSLLGHSKEQRHILEAAIAYLEEFNNV